MPNPKEEIRPCTFCDKTHETLCENCGCHLCLECAIYNEDDVPMCPNC